MKQRAVFFDRDDTLIRNVPYLGDPSLVEILPGVAAALTKLKAAGYLLFIASNQSGVGRGLISREQVAAVNQEMNRQLGEPLFTAIYNSYASPEDPYCDDRKPSPFLVFQARDEHDLDLGNSYFVGDKLIDVQCGRNAGCRPVLVLTGRELSKAELDQARREADHTAKTVTEAAEWICERTEKKSGTAKKPAVKAKVAGKKTGKKPR
jgi:D-glycero-D-manno-heptose 1,7-bisphosphate phosphatase